MALKDLGPCIQKIVDPQCIHITVDMALLSDVWDAISTEKGLFFVNDDSMARVEQQMEARRPLEHHLIVDIAFSYYDYIEHERLMSFENIIDMYGWETRIVASEVAQRAEMILDLSVGEQMSLLVVQYNLLQLIMAAGRDGIHRQGLIDIVGPPECSLTNTLLSRLKELGIITKTSFERKDGQYIPARYIHARFQDKDGRLTSRSEAPRRPQLPRRGEHDKNWTFTVPAPVSRMTLSNSRPTPKVHILRFSPKRQDAPTKSKKDPNPSERPGLAKLPALAPKI
ncbi:hypothetical protein BC940DRAFT_27124 [Gongronella butleri]|nr:hypothetical protein BC940DRAFT_27124 [Gongronella butleri]